MLARRPFCAERFTDWALIVWPPVEVRSASWAVALRLRAPAALRFIVPVLCTTPTTLTVPPAARSYVPKVKLLVTFETPPTLSETVRSVTSSASETNAATPVLTASALAEVLTRASAVPMP